MHLKHYSYFQNSKKITLIFSTLVFYSLEYIGCLTEVKGRICQYVLEIPFPTFLQSSDFLVPVENPEYSWRYRFEPEDNPKDH